MKNLEKFIPINKGNYSMDTNERNLNFEKNRGSAWPDGYKTYSHLPYIEEYSLYHPKTIDRQEKQNAYYDTL